MKVLVVHADYQTPGGEDVSARLEADLLESYGHRVERFIGSNADAAEWSAPVAAARAVWNRPARRSLAAVVERFRPDIVHVNNTFPALSPAVYSAARAGGAAVVQSLRNWRMLCPSATFFREGEHCTLCAGRSIAWPGVRYRCYRGSATASAVSAAVVALHRGAGTFERDIDRYIALSDWARDVFVRYGFDARSIDVKPNFVHPDPGFEARGGAHVIYLGRLSAEKGIVRLVEQWGRLDDAPPLLVVGDGHDEAAVRAAAGGPVQVTSAVGHDDALELLRTARAVVVPSLWAEPFGRVVVEAMAMGTPALTTGRGGLGDLVVDGVSGWFYDPDDLASLAAAVRRMWVSTSATRAATRKLWEQRHSGPANYELLVEVYRKALATRQTLRPAAAFPPPREGA